MVCVGDVLNWLDAYAPFRYAESWDSCGLQVGDPRDLVERVLVALDVTTRTLDEAETKRCQCMITHHPLLFRPLAAVRSDQFPARLVMQAVKRSIHLIAAHTNLDAAREGTNDQLARLLRLESLKPLELNQVWMGEERYGGMGRVGRLPEKMLLGELARVVSDRSGGIDLRVVGAQDREVQQVALCTGSGAGLMDLAIAAGADVYLTGDVKYHEAQHAVEAQLCLIDMGHFHSERLVVPSLASYLRECSVRDGKSLTVVVSEEERDPFWTCSQI